MNKLINMIILLLCVEGIAQVNFSIEVLKKEEKNIVKGLNIDSVNIHYLNVRIKNNTKDSVYFKTNVELNQFMKGSQCSHACLPFDMLKEGDLDRIDYRNNISHMKEFKVEKYKINILGSYIHEYEEEFGGLSCHFENLYRIAKLNYNKPDSDTIKNGLNNNIRTWGFLNSEDLVIPQIKKMKHNGYLENFMFLAPFEEILIPYNLFSLSYAFGSTMIIDDEEFKVNTELKKNIKNYKPYKGVIKINGVEFKIH